LLQIPQKLGKTVSASSGVTADKNLFLLLNYAYSTPFEEIVEFPRIYYLFSSNSFLDQESTGEI